MSDWTDDPDEYEREGAPPMVPPPSTRTAPLPGMPSPATPGRYEHSDYGRSEHDESGYDRSGYHQRGHDHSGHDRGSRTHRPRRPVRRHRFLAASAALTSALLLAGIGTYSWAETRLNQEVHLGALAGRAPQGEGTNYLVVGSDSREGLSQQERKDLRTGFAEGRRTDSMILLHTGADGTTMLSLPRDSWVTIPPYVDPDTGRSYRAQPDKLNAAFSLGGPDLLVRTVERNTGVRIDHYTEIGFAGFVGVVDAVGGVNMCLDRAVRDKDSGANLRKGCQTLDGAEALAFVRQRKQEAQGDLGRTRNQQKFLAALAKKAVTPSTLLNPAKSMPTLSAGLKTLIVDDGTDLSDLASLFEAMRAAASGKGRQLNVPVSDTDFATSKGTAVRWDEPRARALFTALRKDRPVPGGGQRPGG